MIPDYLKRAPLNGLPDSTLNDCLFSLGKRGSGKSFSQRLAMERALTKRLRCGWVDSMGIGWGITVGVDGKQPGFEVVVFGGLHAHITISEAAGKALGTQLARAPFSWVLDLSTLPSKAARVRFMRDFGEAIYENCESQLLLFLDEVDLWAPQNILDKQGPAAQLLGVMHEIVRRGRIKGINIWMASQRPAEVSKGIISQADAMVTFKLMAPQDLDAAIAWMKGHVGKVVASEWATKIPELKKGEAIIYLTEPTVSIAQVQFPFIHTLDTFKPPKKGETVSDRGMAKVDLNTIREQLGEIESDLKANDPVELKRQISDLQRQVKAKPVAAPAVAKTTVIDPAALKVAKEEAREEGRVDGHNKATVDLTKRIEAMKKRLSVVLAKMANQAKTVEDHLAILAATMKEFEEASDISLPELVAVAKKLGHAIPATTAPRERSVPVASVAPKPSTATVAGDLAGPERRIMQGLGDWLGMGFAKPTRQQVAIFADYHERTPSFLNALGSLRTAGLIEHGDGFVWFTDAGKSSTTFETIDDVDVLHNKIRSVLDGPQNRVFDTLLKHGQERVSRDTVAEGAQYHVRTPSFLNALGRLRTMTVCEYASGAVYLRPWVFLEAE